VAAGILAKIIDMKAGMAANTINNNLGAWNHAIQMLKWRYETRAGKIKVHPEVLVMFAARVDGEGRLIRVKDRATRLAAREGAQKLARRVLVNPRAASNLMLRWQTTLFDDILPMVLDGLDQVRIDIEAGRVANANAIQQFMMATMLMIQLTGPAQRIGIFQELRSAWTEEDEKGDRDGKTVTVTVRAGDLDKRKWKTFLLNALYPDGACDRV
jgi:hypothetical protein